jgi:molecular chaperone GrpE
LALENNESTPRNDEGAAPSESPTISAPPPTEGAVESSEGADVKMEPAKDDGEAVLDGSEEEREHVQKRTRRTSRKRLLELVHRKNAVLNELDKELKNTKQQLEAKEDRLLRLAAEFENYKKRVRREWELLQKQANADLLKEIVGGIDDFDRALESLGETNAQVRDGLQMIHNGLMDILRKAGLTEIDALHQKFDPTVHEAVGELEAADIEEGHVAQVVRRGYRLHDAVLRPARVLVSRKHVETGSS